MKKREELERWKNGLGTTNEEGGRNMGERRRTWRRKGAGGSEQKELREKEGTRERGEEEGRARRRVVGGGDRGRRIIRLGELSLSGPS